jgi:cytochrome b561
MKNITTIRSTLLASAALGLALSAHAQPGPSPAETPANWHETCSIAAKFGHSTMRLRQYGSPMSGLMQMAREDSQALPFGEETVIAAFEVPRYSAREDMENAANEFRDATYLACAKRLRPTP